MTCRSKVFSAALLTLFAITGCDSDDDDTGSGTGSVTEPTAAFVGTWTTGCIASQLPPTGADTYFIYEFQADATTWQLIQAGYLDESCTIQFQEIDSATFSRGTTTITGTYTEEGEVTTTDGLQATNLSVTVDTLVNTLDEPDDEPFEATGTTIDALIYLSDTNVLFLDDQFLGINNAPGTLVLTLPFDSVL